MNFILDCIEKINKWIHLDAIERRFSKPGSIENAIIAWCEALSYVLLFVVLIILACTGCYSTKSNHYTEHTATGLDLTIPIGGGQAGIVLGTVKTTYTAVDGGTSFNSQSTSGIGLNGQATTASVTTFRSNAQLNEENIVRIMESPTTSEKAKIVLAKQLGDGVAAPDFEPVALRTRDGAIYSNNYKGNAIPNDFTPTGIDKIVNDAAGIVNNFVDDTTGSVNTVIGGTAFTFDSLFKHITAAKFWTAMILILVIVLIIFFRKKKKPVTSSSVPSLAPPEFHEPTPDAAVDANDDAAGVIHQEHETEVEEPVIIRKKVPWWKRLLMAIAAIFTAWRGLDEEDRDNIKNALKK